MCKHNKDTDKDDSKYNEDLDRVVANMSDLTTNLGLLATSFFGNDGPFTEWQDRAREMSSSVMDGAWKLVSEIHSDIRDAIEDDSFFPKPYQTRLKPGMDEEESPRGWAGWHEQWHNRLNRRRLGQTPYGYYALNTPSSRYYHECLQKNGESVWDSHGYWRCLFPNAAVSNRDLAKKDSNQILTKEDFDNAAAHARVENGVYDLGAKGTYFKQFTDYLNWKELMYENVRAERRRRWNEAKQLQLQAAPGPDTRLQSKAQPGDSTVVSYSVLNVYNATSDGNTLEETRTERYADGTTRTTTSTKRKPADARDWVTVEQSTDVSGQGAQFGAAEGVGRDHLEGHGGWFWSK